MNRRDRRAAAAARTEPYCPDAKDRRGDGFGCPNCRQFEVRTHPADCAVHGEHMELACCWCGTHFFSFNEVEHPDQPNAKLPDNPELQ